MVITQLAQQQIKKILQENNASNMHITLVGNESDGFQVMMTFENTMPAEFITLIKSPLILIDPISYLIKFACTTMDFDPISSELKIKF